MWRPDAVREMPIELRWSATDHPVESGLSSTDHVQPLPSVLTLTCIVTESPTPPATGGPQRVRQALQWLRETANAGRLVDVYTRRLGVLSNYVITAAPTKLDRVQRLAFDLELKEIRVAEATTVSISVDDIDPDDELASTAPDEVDTGEQATTTTGGDPAADEAEDADQSVLLSLLEAL